MLIIADLESAIYHHWRQFKVGKEEEEKTTNESSFSLQWIMLRQQSHIPLL
jgi:hypothetical protein